MSQKLIPQFEANIVLRGKIELLTGMHIGGSKEKLEIGGVDSVVIRNPRNSYPYIPGSSIKGKMRHLLEYITGAVNNPIDYYPEKAKDDAEKDKMLEENLGKVSKSEEIVRLFGIGAREKENDQQLKSIGMGRLIVRDAHPDEETVRMWEEDLGSDANYTEYKAENTIDRITSAANPRFIERVVEGSKFHFEMVYSVFKMLEGEDDSAIQDDLANLITALRLLETSALGKSGSRGYGKIRFHVASPLVLTKQDYKTPSEKWKNFNAELKDDDLSPLTDIQTQLISYPAI
jgi:CRISPR-associated protein Csm3